MVDQRLNTFAISPAGAVQAGAMPASGRGSVPQNVGQIQNTGRAFGDSRSRNTSDSTIASLAKIGQALLAPAIKEHEAELIAEGIRQVALGRTAKEIEEAQPLISRFFGTNALTTSANSYEGAMFGAQAVADLTANMDEYRQLTPDAFKTVLNEKIVSSAKGTTTASAAAYGQAIAVSMPQLIRTQALANYEYTQQKAVIDASQASYLTLSNLGSRADDLPEKQEADLNVMNGLTDGMTDITKNAVFSEIANHAVFNKNGRVLEQIEKSDVFKSQAVEIQQKIRTAKEAVVLEQYNELIFNSPQLAGQVSSFYAKLQAGDVSDESFEKDYRAINTLLRNATGLETDYFTTRAAFEARTGIEVKERQEIARAKMSQLEFERSLAIAAARKEASANEKAAEAEAIAQSAARVMTMGQGYSLEGKEAKARDDDLNAKYSDPATAAQAVSSAMFNNTPIKYVQGDFISSLTRIMDGQYTVQKGEDALRLNAHFSLFLGEAVKNKNGLAFVTSQVGGKENFNRLYLFNSALSRGVNAVTAYETAFAPTIPLRKMDKQTQKQITSTLEEAGITKDNYPSLYATAFNMASGFSAIGVDPVLSATDAAAFAKRGNVLVPASFRQKDVYYSTADNTLGDPGLLLVGINATLGKEKETLKDTAKYTAAEIFAMASDNILVAKGYSREDFQKGLIVKSSDGRPALKIFLTNGTTVSGDIENAMRFVRRGGYVISKGTGLSSGIAPVARMRKETERADFKNPFIEAGKAVLNVLTNVQAGQLFVPAQDMTEEQIQSYPSGVRGK